MLEIDLIGAPEVRRSGLAADKPRSRKTWGVLCFLLLNGAPTSRSRLSTLLFSEAADPMRALRWNLTELRRLLGPEVRLHGDPIVVELPKDTVTDVTLITDGQWQQAIGLKQLGGQLLGAMDFDDSPLFESWLLTSRRHIAGASEDVLREASLALLGSARAEEAIPLAAKLVELNPYVESHQALLIRSLALSGDSEAAEKQLRATTDLYAKELGVFPGQAVRDATSVRPAAPQAIGTEEEIEAAIESGLAAVGAGAVAAGVNTLRLAVALADNEGNDRLMAFARYQLAESLIHSVRGDDEEGAELLHGVVEIARRSGAKAIESRARVELGYTDMLAARYDRARQWLDRSDLA